MYRVACLIFVNLDALPHYSGLQKVHHKVLTFATKKKTKLVKMGKNNPKFRVHFAEKILQLEKNSPPPVI